MNRKAKERCVIVVPIYKSAPSKAEFASFNQLLKTLGSHDICIVTHKDLDVSAYRQRAKDCGVELNFEYFDKSFFESIKGYNRLCLSKDFYGRFTSYEFMLIYQLDAWCFSDQLDFWCDKGYDYIGAPYSMWMKGFSYHWLGTRNGGFSLRKIDYCIKLTSLKHRCLPYITPKGFLIREWQFIKYHNNPVWKKIIRVSIHVFSRIILRSLGYRNTRGYYLDGNINEDYFFSCDAEHAWGVTCNLPDWKESARFSFEFHPEYLYHAIGDKLPFGCHAFEKQGDFYTKNNLINIEQ